MFGLSDSALCMMALFLGTAGPITISAIRVGWNTASLATAIPFAERNFARLAGSDGTITVASLVAALKDRAFADDRSEIRFLIWNINAIGHDTGRRYYDHASFATAAGASIGLAVYPFELPVMAISKSDLTKRLYVRAVTGSVIDLGTQPTGFELSAAR